MTESRRPTPKRPGPSPKRPTATQVSLSVPEKLEAARQRKLRDLRRRRVWAGSLFGAAGVVAVSHVAEHLGAFTVWRPGVDDFIIGYPTAIGLLVLGAIKLGPKV
jgi:hypothetical protein